MQKLTRPPSHWRGAVVVDARSRTTFIAQEIDSVWVRIGRAPMLIDVKVRIAGQWDGGYGGMEVGFGGLGKIWRISST